MPGYIALIRKREDEPFAVEFPDFPGCVTVGDTLEEARKNAVEALRGHIEVMAEFGDAIPGPCSLDEVMVEPGTSDATAFLVDIPTARTKRVNISVPATDLQPIDSYAKQCNMSRSAFLVWAAKHVMQEQVQPE